MMSSSAGPGPDTAAGPSDAALIQQQLNKLRTEENMWMQLISHLGVLQNKLKVEELQLRAQLREESMQSLPSTSLGLGLFKSERLVPHAFDDQLPSPTAPSSVASVELGGPY